MISAAWDWYYGSQDEELLADCEFGEPYSTKRCSNKDVCVRPATLSSGLQVTVFTQVKTRPKEQTDLEKSSNRLKLLRHPNILRHVGIVVTETEVHLVTERVSPLYLQFETADANEVSTGIYDIGQALKFLHEKAELTHNSVSIESIYVTEGGVWKLSNFENACPFAEATASYLKGLKRIKEIVPPEENDQKVTFPLEKKYAHCRDVYALGILLGLFNKQARFASEVPTQELEDLLEEILQKDYRARPKVSELLDTAILTSEYIEIVNFLQSITLKSKSDKTRFLLQLIPRIKRACISDELIAKRITKLLLSPVVLAENEAAEKVIPRLLTPIPVRPQNPASQGLISSCMFARYVIPQIVDLLEVKIIHVRLVLVSNFHRYVHMFDKYVLQETVLPEILLGLHDSNNQLVKASLHALADSVPIVGGDIIVGTEREKIFGFGMPKFNGAVLVDATSLSYELKPKRKPKKPKKKSPQRPKTLLELAMKRERSPSKVKKTDRDLMMLKQTELAMTLMVPQTNGDISHPEEEDAILEVTYNEDPKSSISLTEEKSRKSLPKKASMKMDNKNMNSEPRSQQKVTKTETKDMPIRTTKSIKETKQKAPEIETWAGSESEEEETWVDFDDFEREPPNRNDLVNGEQNMDVQGYSNVSQKTSTSNPAEDKPLKTALPDRKQEKSGSPSLKQGLRQELGNEFEILVSNKMPVTNKELDFFADMAPEIPTRNVPILPSPQNISRDKKRMDSLTTESISTKSSPISVSFAAADDLADDEATDGWENDAVTWDD